MPEQWQYGIAAVGILFIIMAMFSLGRARSRTAASRDSARDHVDRARQKQAVRDDLEALMVDINRMARDLGGQLDAKIIRIEKATQEADERIAQLQALRDSLNDPYAINKPSPDQLVTPQAAKHQRKGGCAEQHGKDEGGSAGGFLQHVFHHAVTQLPLQCGQ